MTLRTDYKEDILPEEGRKYSLISNPDGTTSIEEVTQYVQVGDNYGAADINLLNAIVNTLNTPGAGAHNSIYRGKDLGVAVTDDQYAAINSGTFEDLYIGDYWTIGGVVYRIAAFDYFFNTGDTALTVHHAVIVPDLVLYNATMNATDITTGGYTGSVMYTANLAQAKTTIKAAFLNHVLSHREYLTNAVTSGSPSGGAWFDSEVELMNERMVYGNAVFSPVSDGTTVPQNYTACKSQLPLFAHRADLIGNRETWWLRDVVTASAFAFVTGTGLAYYINASYSGGVRPAFSIS